MFNWNGEKYPFSILDADTMKKFSQAEKTMWDTMTEYEKENAAEGLLNAEGIAAESSMIDTFFDCLLGEGTAEKMFASKKDLGERVKAVKKLYILRNTQLEEHEKRLENLHVLTQGKK